MGAQGGRGRYAAGQGCQLETAGQAGGLALREPPDFQRGQSPSPAPGTD